MLADEISILDLKFGVIHDKIKIDEIVEIKCLNDHLLIVESNSVSMCRLIEAPVNLSSVVGKRLQPSHSLPIINSWKTPSIEVSRTALKYLLILICDNSSE